MLVDQLNLSAAVDEIVSAQPVVDMHTHLYPPTFGTPVPNATGRTDTKGLMLWGLDELLTYHYLVAEVFRVVPATKLPYEQFWKMSKRQQADHIWKHLFVERSPISEACRGVLTTMRKLGLDVSAGNLADARKWFAEQDPSKYVDKVMAISGVGKITMTNAVFDDNERERWLADASIGSDPRFGGVLRIDPMLRDWPTAARKLKGWGYDVSGTTSEKTVAEARRFLGDWIAKVKASYIAVSLPPDWRYPADPGAPVEWAGQQVLEKVVLPVCGEAGIPFAMMIGSRLRVNPALGDAGDMVGRSDVQSVVSLCREFPANRFFVTMLARENQHELCVAARKFGNLMVFGCWWFLNNPSLIDELTRMRIELLGSSFIPQHSDARVLDQLVYKWDHSRQLIAGVLKDKYQETLKTGWKLTRQAIEQDVARMLKGNYEGFVAG